MSGFSLCLNEKTGFVGQKHKHDFHSFHNVMAFLLILDHKQENKKEPKDNFYKRHFSVAAKDKNIYTIFIHFPMSLKIFNCKPYQSLGGFKMC